MILTERHHIQGTPEIIRLCTLSKELYNKCNYYMRQAWFTDMPLPNISELTAAVKGEEFFQQFNNTKTAVQTIRQCLSDWSNFNKSIWAWRKCPSKFTSEPKPPNYKNKLAQVIFYNQTIKGGRSKNKLTTITPTNNCFSVKSDKNFKQVIITPKRFGFIIDVQYEQETPEKINLPGFMCIDIGVNNLCAITSDQMEPILVNGRILKSINQKFNKYHTKRESQKRYFRIENYFHHTSKLIICYCLENNIGTIIIGKNLGWKQRTNLGSVTNQNFQCIPFNNLIQKIQYKAELAGIEVVLTEEAYTSKASFLDRDPLPTYQKGVKHKFSGHRMGRGRYKTKDGRIINSDCNGSGNIGRKVIRDEDVILRLGKSLAARPVRVNPLKAFCV